jgi:DNA-binding GntR family transcriptional regulator
MRAAELVTARIRSGEYAPGQRLNLGLIADEMDVERATISRAMRVLDERGLVKFWRGLGWYVNSPAADQAAVPESS